MYKPHKLYILYILPSYSVYPVRDGFTPGIRIIKVRSATRVIFPNCVREWYTASPCDIRAPREWYFASRRIKDHYFSVVGDSTRGVPPRSEWRGKSWATRSILNINAFKDWIAVLSRGSSRSLRMTTEKRKVCGKFNYNEQFSFLTVIQRSIVLPDTIGRYNATWNPILWE